MFVALFGAVLLALGVAMGWYAARPLAVLPRLLRTPIRSPGEAADADGFVVCRGVASRHDEETLKGPFSGSPSLGFEYAVSERAVFGVGLPWFWTHLDDGVATVRFRLDGDGDHVAVDPSPRRFTLDAEPEVTTVRAGDQPPDRIRRFLDAREKVSPPADWLARVPWLGTRRYLERRIEPGGEYLVAGRIDRREGEPVLAGDLLIADRSPRRVGWRRAWQSLPSLLVAAAFVAGGGLLLFV